MLAHKQCRARVDMQTPRAAPPGATGRLAARFGAPLASLLAPSQPAAAAAAPAAATAAVVRPVADAQTLRPQVACSYSYSSRSSSPAMPPNSSSSQASPAVQQPLEPRMQVSVNATSSGIAKAVLLRLQQLGHVEVWATSAANHFTAVAGLGLAAQQLQHSPLQTVGPPLQQQQEADSQEDYQQQQQQQEQELEPLEGLVVTAVMTSHDQPVKDDQKRRLAKLELQVQPAPPLDPALLAPGQPGCISTNRTTGVSAILGLLQEQLLVREDDSSSRVAPGAVCVVEARGEQAVTRALKAALSLQAAAGQQLLLRPVAGKVVDVVAEKRGQAALADGLLLVISWAS